MIEMVGLPGSIGHMIRVGPFLLVLLVDRRCGVVGRMRGWRGLRGGGCLGLLGFCVCVRGWGRVGECCSKGRVSGMRRGEGEL